MNLRKRFRQAGLISSSLSIVCLVTGLTAIRALAQSPPPPPEGGGGGPPGPGGAGGQKGGGPTRAAT
ncbi:MAG: hypothetical protein F4218_05305, partial [Synechococcus sp. SB0677_bin_5]|nr:hypothetical protein [Synechococcus sp. SB0677_bin_5]